MESWGSVYLSICESISNGKPKVYKNSSCHHRSVAHRELWQVPEKQSVCLGPLSFISIQEVFWKINALFEIGRLAEGGWWRWQIWTSYHSRVRKASEPPNPAALSYPVRFFPSLNGVGFLATSSLTHKLIKSVFPLVTLHFQRVVEYNLSFTYSRECVISELSEG